jgi:hypothetical protein
MSDRYAMINQGIARDVKTGETMLLGSLVRRANEHVNEVREARRRRAELLERLESAEATATSWKLLHDDAIRRVGRAEAALDRIAAEEPGWTGHGQWCRGVAKEALEGKDGGS